MKTRPVFFLLALALTAVPAWGKTVLPDACGSDNVRFDVKTKKQANPAPTIAPVDGKARVVFIESGPGSTTRFGVDGKWVGAANNNSYFILDLEPGMHHLCSAVQGDFSAPKDRIGISSFNAEGGKVYYLAYMITSSYRGSIGTFFPSRSPASATTPSSPTYVPGPARVDSASGLIFLDEDEGKFRVKSFKISVSTVHKDDPGYQP